VVLKENKVMREMLLEHYSEEELEKHLPNTDANGELGAGLWVRVSVVSFWVWVRVSESGSLGLGLWVWVRVWVRVSGSRSLCLGPGLWVRASGFGSGSTFSFCLPIGTRSYCAVLPIIRYYCRTALRRSTRKERSNFTVEEKAGLRFVAI
jgi:hypothetical protein